MADDLSHVHIIGRQEKKYSVTFLLNRLMECKFGTCRLLQCKVRKVLVISETHNYQRGLH
jgi:hypothetical protein